MVVQSHTGAIGALGPLEERILERAEGLLIKRQQYGAFSGQLRTMGHNMAPLLSSPVCGHSFGWRTEPGIASCPTQTKLNAKSIGFIVNVDGNVAGRCWKVR